MKNKTPLLLSLALTVATAAACAATPPYIASADSREDAAEATRDEAKYAAADANADAAVDNVRFLQPIDSIELVGPLAVLVWEKPTKAWLVDLRGSPACDKLSRSTAFSLDVMSQTLNDNNGYVEGDKGARCKIERIREEDVPAYRATLRESGHG